MARPKAVVFDLGKVLLDFDYGITIAKIQKFCTLSVSDLQKLINQSPLLHRYETNLLTSAQFFAEVQTLSGFCGTFDQFQGMFADIFTAIEPMVALHGEISARGLPTYVFSNTNDLAIRHVRTRFPFFQNFNGYILSYEQNLMKPDPRIYAVVERISGKQGSDLLYIDDRPENILPGQERGWQTILHQDPQSTEAAIRKAGLL